MRFNMAETPTKQYASTEKGVCRTCNSNIIPKNHPLELFGPKAMEERIAVFLEKVCGVKFSFDDGLPSRVCRICYGKIKKFQEFIKVVLHSKTQQESIIRSKRGKRVEESPTTSSSPATRRERKKTRSSETDNPEARVSLFTSFTPTASTPKAPTMRRILPKPTEQVPESSKTVTGEETKLPARIGPDPEKEKSKSAEILANSGRRNPVLVKVKLNLGLSLNRFKIYTLIQAKCLSLGPSISLTVHNLKVIYFKTFFSQM